MANDTLQFVDSIASSPIVRLDVNDGTKWECEVDSLDFAPPPLRRAINGTLLTDGSVQSASSYDNRVIRCTFSLVDTTIDNVATQIQLLNRELDRDTNFLKWLPSTATAPVFFRTLRSPVVNVHEVATRAMTTFDVEILAEPFALGLREDITVGTVNNDPAAGSNGLFFDVTGVKGDTAAPAVLIDSSAYRACGLLAVRTRGTPSDLVFFAQCESMTLGTDTTNPGGGPDGVMSGTGLNNYVRTSFATDATLVTRVTWTPTLTTAQQIAIRGTYRLFACVRRSGSVSDIALRMRYNQTVTGQNVTGSSVASQKVTGRILVDLGLVNIGVNPAGAPGRFGSDAPSEPFSINLQANRTSGAETLDWDYLLLAPADEQLLLWTIGSSTDLTTVGSTVDGPNESIYGLGTKTAAIFGGTVQTLTNPVSTSGGFPFVKPNTTNRFYLAYGTGAPPAQFQHDKTVTSSLTVSYWPRYLYDRPATT